MTTLYDIYQRLTKFGNAWNSPKFSDAEKDAVSPPVSSIPVTLYDILEVQSGAQASDIKVAYRKLARKHHPDTGDGDTDTWLKIQKAYKVLADEERRKKYDLAQKILEKPTEVMVDDWSTVWNATYPYSSGSSGAYYYPTSGSTGYAPSRTHGLHVGYQIPTIGGVVAHVQSSRNNPNMGVAYRVIIDATLPQSAVQNLHQQMQNFHNGDWWRIALRLDPTKYVVNIVSVVTNPIHQLGSVQPVGSLGAQFELEVIEI